MDALVCHIVVSTLKQISGILCRTEGGECHKRTRITGHDGYRADSDSCAGNEVGPDSGRTGKLPSADGPGRGHTEPLSEQEHTLMEQYLDSMTDRMADVEPALYTGGFRDGIRVMKFINNL